MELALHRMTILSAIPTGPPFLQANNVAVNAQASLNDTQDRVGVMMSYSVDSVTADEIELTGAKLSVTMGNFDVAAIKAYNELSQLSFFGQGNTSQTLPAMQDAAYQFLAAEPSVEFGPLTFQWNDERFQGRVRINADTEMLPQKIAFSLLDTNLWTRLFTVDAELELSSTMAERLAIEALKYQIGSSAARNAQALDPEALKAMAEAQGPGMLGLLALQGMIETSEIGYRTRATFAKGQLNVNGTEIPLGPQF